MIVLIKLGKHLSETKCPFFKQTKGEGAGGQRERETSGQRERGASGQRERGRADKGEAGRDYESLI